MATVCRGHVRLARVRLSKAAPAVPVRQRHAFACIAVLPACVGGMSTGIMMPVGRSQQPTAAAATTPSVSGSTPNGVELHMFSATKPSGLLPNAIGYSLQPGAAASEPAAPSRDRHECHQPRDRLLSRDQSRMTATLRVTDRDELAPAQHARRICRGIYRCVEVLIPSSARLRGGKILQHECGATIVASKHRCSSMRCRAPRSLAYEIAST